MRRCLERKGKHLRRRRRGKEGRSSHLNGKSFVRAPVGVRRETEGCSAPLPGCHLQNHHPLPSLVLSLCFPRSPPPALHQILQWPPL